MYRNSRMFEARIVQGAILKKIVEAIQELVTDANLDCNEEQGISMQVRMKCVCKNGSHEQKIEVLRRIISPRFKF